MADDELARKLAEWADESRLDQARSVRSNQHWTEQAAAESSTFTGLLLDAYDTEMILQVHTMHGRQHRGSVAEVGADFVAVTVMDDTFVLIPFTSIGSIQIAASSRSLGAVSDREPQKARTLADMLEQFAVEREYVRFVTTMSAQARAGTITAVGADLVTIGLESPPETLFVPLNQLTEITVL